jgi:hypothetical protein
MLGPSVTQGVTVIVPTPPVVASVSGTTIAAHGTLPHTGAPFLSELVYIALLLVMVGQLLRAAGRRAGRRQVERPVPA